MNKFKKIGIVAGILLIAIGAFWIYKKSPLTITATENSTKVAETEAAKETHILTVALNLASYEIEYNDTFDIATVDVAIIAESVTTVQFADGSTSKQYDSVGEKIEQVVIKDDYNNKKTAEITITVKDTQAPVISGVTDCRITEGHKFNALGGVVAMDNADADVSDTLVCSDYDIDSVGTQTLTITAQDKSGNVASVDFNLQVIEKPVLLVETVPVLVKTYLSQYKEVIPYDGNYLRNITCWGDSLTSGQGSGSSYPHLDNIIVNGVSKDINGTTETTALSNLINLNLTTKRIVYNMGVGGEDSRTIACRQGGLSMYVNNITIPASGSVSFSQITCEDGNVIDACRGTSTALTEAFDACTIGGITGKLTFDNDLYTFKRAVDGTEMVIAANTAIITPTSLARKDDILIIEMGNNNGWDADYGVLIKQYEAMIKYSNCKYFIIIGDTDGSQIERGDWDQALQDAFGEHYINMRTYLVNNGLSDCGIKGTQSDLEMVALQEVPDSLKSDWSHLNSYGYYSKGNAIYAKGVQLGYWK